LSPHPVARAAPSMTMIAADRIPGYHRAPRRFWLRDSIR
jgi:hypothetical protein